MKSVKTVAEYFEKNQKWQQELMLLRDIILSAGMEETIKWGGPVYTVNGKNIVGIGSFKSYFGLWFFQGTLLKDTHKKLYNAQEGITRALRQWRFTSIDEVEPELVIEYINEAIQNQKEGKEIKPKKKPMPEIPLILLDLFKEDPLVEDQFKKKTPFRQREFIEYILQAKKEETRLRRLNKIANLLREGVGLNDKYR